MHDCTNLTDYMERYGALLGKQAAAELVPLHLPGIDPVLDFSDLLREPLPAQAHVCTAGVKALDRQKNINICAECGTGKTFMSMAIAHRHANGRAYRGVVFCPPHLTGKWQREIEETIPGADVYQLRSYRDLTDMKRGDWPATPEWFIVSQNTAKMEPQWKPSCVLHKNRSIGIPHCPDCGQPVMKEDPKTKRTVPVPVSQLRKKRTWCDQCGGALWTHTHKLDRWPVAKFANNKLKRAFDYVIFDEIHQAKGDQTAVGRAMGALASTAKKTISATGTIIGGYANHLRSILFRLCPESLVAEGLTWEESMAFNERYGRIETTIVDRDGGGSRGGSDNKSSSGSQSHSVRRNVRPGVMPTIMKHLIGTTVFLSLEEVADNLPPLEETVIPVAMDAQQLAAYKEIEDSLTAAIRTMVSKGDRRLLGKMLNTLLGYPDHPYGYGEIGYYQKDDEGANQIFIKVCDAPNLNAETIRPKEQALLDLVVAEKAAGRQVWVFSTMTTKRDVTARLEKLLAKAGHTVKVLRSSQVETRKREAWLAQHGPEADVVLSHPKLVETGLDLFGKDGSFNFCTLCFFNAGYNLFTLRQASRRSWRIGQLQNCKVVYFYYADTMQGRAMTLMGRKLTAAEAVEGKFSSEGLAAMAGEEGSMEMALAKSLVDKLDDMDAVRGWERVVQVKHGNSNMLGPPPDSRTRRIVTVSPHEFVRMLVNQLDLFADSPPAASKPHKSGSGKRASVSRPQHERVS